MLKKIFSFAFILIIVDQAVKGLISTFMTLHQSIPVIKDFFHLTYVQNTGAAFSILEGNQLFLIITGIISLNVIYFLLIKGKELKNIEVIVYSVLIAGIIGNTIDRIVFNYVIDYLDFNIFGYDFAIFNIADCYIVISVIMIFVLEFLEVKNENNSRKRK